MNNSGKIWITVLILALAALATQVILVTEPTHAAGLWYVGPGGSDGADCLSPATRCATINGALNKAGFVAGDTIRVQTGTYTGSGDEVALLNKSATLSGGWNSAFTTQNGMSTIDGQGARRGMMVNSGVTAIVERFIVENGEIETGYGDGILNAGNLILKNVHVRNNSKNSGGGGIYNDVSGEGTINNSAITGNGTINYCHGGIHNQQGIVTVNNSTISGNASSNIYCAHIAGISNSNGTVTLNNTTISNNIGGSIWSFPAGTTTLQNTISASNKLENGTPSDCAADSSLNSSGYNIIGVASCTFSGTTGDQIGSPSSPIEPKLGSLTGLPGYHPLLSGSPAINAGNPAGCMSSTGLLTTDQRGMPRIGHCDIGAYEFGLSTTKSASGSYTAGQTLTYNITLTNEVGTDIAGISITDTLPSSLTYVPSSFSASTGTGSESGGVITWNGTVPANNTATVSFQAAINSNAACSFITNKALISSGAGSGGFEVQTSGITDCTCNLTKYPGNPVLSKGANGTWDDDDVWRPMVLKEGSSYKMWYVADDGSSPDRIGLATSTNGLSWTKYGGNPVLSPGGGWEAGGLSGGSVIIDSGQYKMWYTGFDSNGVARVGYATSPDGINWTKYGGNPVLDVGASGGWEDADVMFPSVLKQGSVYHMWYEGNDGSGQSTRRIGHATSTDGLTWVKDPANPVLDVGPSGGWDWLGAYGPNVIPYNNTFIMWYSGRTLPAAWQTGYALSTDGANWTRQKLLIPEGAAGAFDNASADYASVIADGSNFKVWYSGYNGADYTIGYATAQVCSAASSGPSTAVYLPIVLKAWNPQYPCPAYYTDNFSDPGSGWVISENSNVKYGYTGGTYQILAKLAQTIFWSTPGAKATDFTAAVSARRASGNSGDYGLVFGINEDGNQWYQFLIGSNNYSLWRYNNGNWTALKNWTVSGAIATGTNWNRLKVIRQGSSIAVYVNNSHLTTINDSSFTGWRRIGLVVASPTSGSLDARFDDFSLYPASCGVGAAEADFEMGKPEIHEVPAPFDRFESP